MFQNFLTRLFGESPDPQRLNAADSEVAIAALMVRMARADDHYGEVERNRIDQVIARRRGVDMAEAATLRAAAEMTEAEAPDTVRFTRMIKERIALEDRLGVIAALWEIAYADGRRSSVEETLVRLVTGLLGVPDRDAGLVRQQVLENLGMTEK